MSSLNKSKFCWLPVRLARHVNGERLGDARMEFIGWVWMQRARLTKNLNHGWVAFLDSQPNNWHCEKCGQLLPE